MASDRTPTPSFSGFHGLDDALTEVQAATQSSKTSDRSSDGDWKTEVGGLIDEIVEQATQLDDNALLDGESIEKTKIIQLASMAKELVKNREKMAPIDDGKIVKQEQEILQLETELEEKKEAFKAVEEKMKSCEEEKEELRKKLELSTKIRIEQKAEIKKLAKSVEFGENEVLKPRTGFHGGAYGPASVQAKNQQKWEEEGMFGGKSCERIECPCIPNKCQFVINSGRWSLTTTSLEETAAINELMIRHPLMKPKEVKAAATLKLVQISIESKKEAIKMGATCPNVEKLAKRIGWEKELEMVKKELAKLVEPPRKVLKHQHLIATFGDLPADAPKHVIQIKEGIAENFGRKYQLIGTEMLLVLAKSTPQQSMFEDVRKLVMGLRNLKFKAKIVILPLPLEGSLEDMLEIEKFSRICSGMPEVSYIQANKKSENRGLPVCVLADVKKTSTWTGLKEYLKMVMMDNEVKEEMEENMWRITLKSLDDVREGEPEIKKARK